MRPDHTQEFDKGIDAGFKSLFKTCTGIDINSWTVIAKERLRLPLKNKGCGLQEEVDRRHGQFVGAMLQSMIPLMNQTGKDSCAIKGMLHIPAIANLLGEGTFYHPLTAPWETLLNESSPSSKLANGL